MIDRLATDVSKYGTVRKDMGGPWVMTEWLWKMKLERAAMKYLDFISKGMANQSWYFEREVNIFFSTRIICLIHHCA